MALTGMQTKFIPQALGGGFPTSDRLAMMLKLEMDVVLDHVTAPGDSMLRAFKLIT